MNRHAGDLGAAALAALAVAGLGSGSTRPWWVAIAAVIAALTLLIRPVAERVASVPLVAANGIPGIPPVAVGRGRAVLVAWARAVTAPVTALVAWSGRPFAAAIVATVGGLILAGTAYTAYRAIVRSRGQTASYAERIAALGPQFAIYTSRISHNRYQIAMWQELLVESGARGIVIVRDRSALRELAPGSPWPVLLLPRAEDLEIALAPSLRAVFYVNTLPRNLDMVAWRGPRHVYLGHGDSDKPLSSHPGHAMFDEIWVAGQHSIERYAERGVAIEPSKFRIISRPQLAELTMTRPADSGRPTALYAPTWNGYNSLTRLSSLGIGYGIVEALIAGGARVVFRPHPMSGRTRSGRREIGRIRKLLREDTRRTGTGHAWGIEATGATFATVASQADLLVTDPSSVIADFLVTGRPIIVVKPEGLSEADPLPSVDEVVLPALYRVRGDLADLPAAIGDALGADHREAARTVARDALFGQRPGGGWEESWRAELARVLGATAR
ncbi:CDP-glycerol glycerophosphotransferase family protein [Rarobacter faecitabidus]|uniref:CDP-glycerol glycerophosphotransferase family protein n=1 Tax=Rarobacter faecitabidus TaxID=13243 RepID=UPI001151381D|nr:CDP-glycerol glycerophosphotransferase family protein [Rarobacter faecitabidus]